MAINALIARPQVVDAVGALGRGSDVGAGMANRRHLNALRGAISEYGAGSPQAFSAFGQADPASAMNVLAQRQQAAAGLAAERRKQLGAALGTISNLEGEQFQRAYAGLYEMARREGAQLEGVPRPGEATPEWARTAAGYLTGEVQGGGDDLTAFQRETASLSPEEREQAVRIRAGLEPRAQSGAQVTPRSAIGKINEDFANGFLTEEQRDAAVADALQGTGMEVEVSPDGSVRLVQGSNAGLGRAGRNSVDQLAINAEESYARLNRISDRIENSPELLDAQSLEGNLRRWSLSWQDYITGGDLTEEQADYLTQVTQLRGDVLENLNYTIKEITGAAMTEPEARRIGATLPGIEDGPVQFKAKLDRAMNRVREALARYNYWRNGGFGSDYDNPADAAPLSDMGRIIDERIKALIDEAKESGMEPEAAAQRAAAIASAEFGI